MTDLDIMKQALEALEDIFGKNKVDVGAINALRERLAQPEQEPVAWMHPDGRVWTFGRGFDRSTFTIPLYTTPPVAQRTWVELTDEDKCKPDLGEWVELNEDWLDGYQAGLEFANKKLKERNT